MQTIILVMQRRPVAQGIIHHLESNQDIRLLLEPDHNHAQWMICSHSADIALIEVAEAGVYDTARCLELCTLLREEAPTCKLLLMCPEQNAQSVSQAVEAKRQKRIDDFIFYDSTMDYLASKLQSM
ncbi:hypothetical protein LJC20_00040 [Eubacteriales bacterium OttesenSCG-928-M02]|nr:hypothetical protein [Eubacteriales bacterium OttesenSCG-928-M02]